MKTGLAGSLGLTEIPQLLDLSAYLSGISGRNLPKYKELSKLIEPEFLK